jgi:hypothetical protein
MSSPVADTLRDLAAALRGVGEGWYLFGAQAAILRGSARVTMDVDITLLPGQADNAEILDRLRAGGFSLRVPDVDAFAARTRVLPMLHDATQMAVDVVLGGPGLEQLFLDAAETRTVDGVPLRLPTVEHLVVMKLLAGRPHDLQDALAMARSQALQREVVAELVDAIAVGMGEDDVRHMFAEFERLLATP